MANIFKVKTLVSKSGIFSNEIIAPNLIYNTGNQNINGNKTFSSRPTVNGTGILLSGEAASLPTTIVYTTGDQTIIDNKLFSGNNTSIDFISGALLKVSGNSVLTGIIGTGNFITLNDLNKDYQKIYISNTFGNDTTAQIGNKYRPYASLQTVWNNLIFPNPFPQYVLNIDSSTSVYSVNINKDWPSTVYIESNSTLSPSVSINSSAGSFGNSAYNVNITDISDKKVSLFINLTAPVYQGGPGNNGGNGGNVFLKNCLVNSITSVGANGAGLSSFNGGNGGNISLVGCEVASTISTIGGYNVSGPNSTVRGGGNVYVENTKFTASSPAAVIFISTNGFSNTSMGSIRAINSTLGGSSSTSVNIARASNNPTISLDGCIYYNLGLTLGGNGFVDIKNSTNLTKNESISSSYYSGSANLFYNNLSVVNNNLSGIFNNLTLHDNQDRPHLTGRANTLTIDFSGGININNNVSISGNTVLTGDSNFYATSTNLASTGSTLNLKINSLSGSSVLLFGTQQISGAKTFVSNAFFQNDVTITGNLRATGVSFFNNNLNIGNILNVGGNSNLSGNLTVAGNINFRSGINVTGDLRVNGNILNQSVVLTSSRQIISGIKTFTDKVLLNTYTTSGYNISNDDYRLNIAGNQGEDTSIQLDSYGVNATSQIMARTARGMATDLSGLLKNDVIFNIAAKGYVSGLSGYSQNSRASIRFATDEDWVITPDYTGQGTYLVFRTTNIGNTSSIDKVIISTSGLNILDGNIYVSGNQVLTGIDLSLYATVTNLATTGSDLQTQINNLGNTYATVTNLATTGSNLQTQINNLGNTYATVTNLATTGSDLNNLINSLSGTLTGNYVTRNNGQFINRPTVNGTGILLSGEAASLPTTIVYTTGDQLISGNKSFLNNLAISGTGFFNNFNLNNIDALTISGVNINIIGNRPTVNGSGVLLIGEASAGSSNNFFVLSFDHTSDQPVSNSHNYFAAGNLGFNSSNSNRRYIQMLEAGIAKKATWQHIAGTSLASPALVSTGYLINVTTNTFGVINPSILSTNTNIPNNFTGLINPPVIINIGDFVVCSLFTPNFTTVPTGVRDTVRVYCY